MIEFKPWPKTARYNRDIVITEKIDGTNAAVQIIPLEDHPGIEADDADFYYEDSGGNEYLVVAQSRKNIITPEKDNAGFAKWVAANAKTLVADLGPGVHFGEWWGQGIQRRYGMDRKVFSLFNTGKWQDADFATDGLDVVPVLYEGPHDYQEIQDVLELLRHYGSRAAEEYGFYNQEAEGVCIFHTASRQVYKVTLKDDDQPKSAVA
jgi:hypothetical protein